jgi:hypothetical protein
MRHAMMQIAEPLLHSAIHIASIYISYWSKAYIETWVQGLDVHNPPARVMCLFLWCENCTWLRFASQGENGSGLGLMEEREEI